MKPTGLLLLLLTATLAAAQTELTPLATKKVSARDLGFAYTLKPVEPAASAPAASGPVIVLPDFDVRERPLDLEPHRLLTAKGRLAEAKRRELSPLYQRTLGPLSLVAAIYFNPLLILSGARPNDAEAMVLFEQDERLRRRHEADSLIELLKDSDPTAYRELRGTMRETFQLRSPNTGEH